MGNSTSDLTDTETASELNNTQGGIVLYGLPLSPNTQRVLAVLIEKGLKYEFKKVNFMESEHKSRQYLEGLQPFGLFPVLIDDNGFRIYESRAICRYLEEKYKGKGTELIPTKDLKTRYLFEQAVNIEAFNFDPAASGIIREKFVKKVLGRGEPDESKIAQFREELASKLNVYEKILSKQPYMAGQVYTLADLFHLPCAALLIKMGDGDLIEAKPNVKNWWEKISSRSSWKTVEKMML
ncbi:hypothetical protein I4U23_015620 [Adineta vaga]|nr:hypothetical protein I4U23_015620 [Adineta vaga]